MVVFVTEVNEFSKFLIEKLETIDQRYFYRNLKIDAKDFLYHELIANYEHLGLKPATNLFLQETKQKIVTPQAFHLISTNIPHTVWRELLDSLQRKYFNSQKGVLAVDGSKISICKKIRDQLLNEINFPLTQKSRYRKALLTTVYDVENNIPLYSTLTTHHNEIKAFKELQPYFQKGDLFVFDRGYLSFNFAKWLETNGYYYLMRSPCGATSLYDLKGDDVDYINKTDPLERARKIEYVIKPPKLKNTTTLKPLVVLKLKRRYVFLTNLPRETHNADQIKELYHARWKIEEYYKFLKMRLGGDFYNFKTKEAVLKKLVFQEMATIITQLMSHFVTKAKQNNTQNKPNNTQNKPQNSSDQEPKTTQKTSPYYYMRHMVRLTLYIIYRKKGLMRHFRLMKTIFEKCCNTTCQSGRHYKREVLVRKRRTYKNGEKKNK